jgi:hypothetical protein
LNDLSMDLPELSSCVLYRNIPSRTFFFTGRKLEDAPTGGDVSSSYRKPGALGRSLRFYSAPRHPTVQNGDCADNLRFLLAVYALASSFGISKTSDHDVPLASIQSVTRGLSLSWIATDMGRERERIWRAARAPRN